MTLLIVMACGGRPPTADIARTETPSATVAATATTAIETWMGDDAPRPDQVAVAITDTSGGTTAVELVCASGYRDRRTVLRDGAEIGGTVWFQGVGSEPCNLYFKGGPPARFGPVRGGSAWLCSLIGTTAVCEAKVSAAAPDQSHQR